MRPTSLLLAATLLLVVRLSLRMSACQPSQAEQREADARARAA